MAPESTAAKTRQYDWDCGATRIQLFLRCPTLSVAEIDRELARIYHGGDDDRAG